MQVDTHIFLVLGFGTLALLAAWLPLYLTRLPLSLPMVCLAAGFVVLAVPSVPKFATPKTVEIMKYVTEAVLIIAILGAGLSLDRRMGLRRWSSTWRLLGIAMPLGFAAMALLAWAYGGFALSTALLIAAALAPTDPVLASDLRVGPPGTGEEGEVRQALTSEAGLNDGLAAPFALAALAVVNGMPIDAGWLLNHLIWKVALAAAMGWLLGWGMGWFQFKVPRIRDSDTADGLAAIGLAFLSYGLTEALGGYGFVAVFVSAVRLRDARRDDATHRRMADFAGQIEHLVAMLVIVLFAVAVARGLLAALTWRDVALVAMFLLLVRPLTAYVSLIGAPHSFMSRAATAFFGIRGVGTLYYLAFALSQASFPQQGRSVALACATVLGSIILHGAAATPVMRKLDRMRTSAQRGTR
jgi:NhaP-type Na+/H+ or K+/H+ antiporter